MNLDFFSRHNRQNGLDQLYFTVLQRKAENWNKNDKKVMFYIQIDLI